MRLKFLKSRGEKTGPRKVSHVNACRLEAGATNRAKGLMDGVEHAVPAGACGKMGDGIENGEDTLAKGGFGVIIAVGVDGPVNEEGAAHDGFAVDKAPVAAVGAVVAIIAHGEIFSWRHDQFVALYVFADFVGPLDLNGRDEKLIAGRGESVIQGIVARRGIVDDVGFIQGFAVDEDLLVDNLQTIPGKADDALHEVRMILVRIFEDDDIAALEVAVWKKLFIPVAAAAKDEFVDEEMIAYEEGLFH